MRNLSSRHTVALAIAAVLILVAVGVLGIEGDPDVMSLRMVPVIAIGAVLAHVSTRSESRAYRWAVRVALAAALVLFWMIGAVGALGPDDEHPADVMYIGVLAIGVGGAIVARFRASGMARALFATAAAQMAIPMVAVLAGLHPPGGTANLTAILGTLILNGLFAALFIGAALLFAKAGGSGRHPAGPRAGLPS